MTAVPKTKYATAAGGVSIAYQVVGEGPVDLVFVPGFVSSLDLAWEIPRMVDIWDRLSSFSRLILFDKQGSGLSDPITRPPTLEQRMDDVRAVMDAAGSDRSVLFGYSEGAPMCLLFAATYPERTQALILFGGMARTTEAPDYPYAAPAAAQMEASLDLLAPYWGEGVFAEMFSPSVAHLPETREAWARLERTGASPGRIVPLFQTFIDTDVRSALPTISAPTLLLHRRGDRVVSVHGARWMAEQIPNATLVEFPGIDHSIWIGEDWTPIIDAVEEFVTGTPPVQHADRVLATIVFTDIVDSTAMQAKLGDARWNELMNQHDETVERELARHRGKEVKTTGDGVLATFDGPARAVRCAQAIVSGVRQLDIDVRVGIHTGEVELRGQDIGGIAVNVGQRISALARSGEVLVSSTVKDLVTGSGITFDERGTHLLKGVPDEWRLFAVQS